MQGLVKGGGYAAVAGGFWDWRCLGESAAPGLCLSALTVESSVGSSMLSSFTSAKGIWVAAAVTAAPSSAADGAVTWHAAPAGSCSPPTSTALGSSNLGEDGGGTSAGVELSGREGTGGDSDIGGGTHWLDSWWLSDGGCINKQTHTYLHTDLQTKHCLHPSQEPSWKMIKYVNSNIMKHAADETHHAVGKMQLQYMQ